MSEIFKTKQVKTFSTRESRYWVNVGKYRNYDYFCMVMHGKYYNLPVWRVTIKTLELIYFSVEHCEIVVAIKYDCNIKQQQQREQQNRETPCFFQRQLLNQTTFRLQGKIGNFAPTLPNIINEN